MERKDLLTGYAIVIVDRGFVYVGNVTVDDKWCVISKARNIRSWGTTLGLGELALSGPTEKTKLDDCGTVRIPIHAVIHVLDSEEKRWNK